MSAMHLPYLVHQSTEKPELEPATALQTTGPAVEASRVRSPRKLKPLFLHHSVKWPCSTGNQRIYLQQALKEKSPMETELEMSCKNSISKQLINCSIDLITVSTGHSAPDVENFRQASCSAVQHRFCTTSQRINSMYLAPVSSVYAPTAEIGQSLERRFHKLI